MARQIVDIVNDALLVTLAAQVTTLPLLLVYFRQLSTVALIAALALPLGCTGGGTGGGGTGGGGGKGGSRPDLDDDIPF